MKTIETLDSSPFKHLIMTIGELPASYVESMTYYEMLAWLCNYVQKTVIPAVNNNAEAVAEIQQWIETLDLQDEVDHKLDEMAASGELAEIIAQYIQLNGVLAFNTVNEMVNATNIVNGSICKTLGLSSYTDGGGRFYKIREIRNTDVVDGVNLIAISNNDQLVAELIPEDVIEDINSIRQELAKKPLVIIGDSHSTPINVPAANAWYTIVGRKLGLEVYNFAVGGSGYVREVTSGGVTGINFSKQVDNAISDSRFNNDDVKMVIVYGGVNDLSDEYASSLASNCASLVDKINTNFTNAIVCIVGINAGPNNFLLANNQSNLHYWQLMRQACVGKPAVFINSCLWNRKGSQNTNPYYNTENSHPNELGDKNVAANILNSLFGTSSIRSSSDPNVCVYSATTGTGTLNISASSDQLIISGNATLDANGVAEFTDSNYIMNNKFSPQYLTATNTALTTAYITFNNTTHILKIKGSANQNYYFRTQVNLNI